MSSKTDLPKPNPEVNATTSIELSTISGVVMNIGSTKENDREGQNEEPCIPRRKLKLLSAGFSFFVAGTNDGSMGALRPYILASYHIRTSFIAVLYLCTFLGWLFAALTNSHLPKFLNLGTLLALGAGLQLFSQCLRPWTPPFGILALTFFLTGLGQAYQDSHGNTFVSGVGERGAHRWLGFIHAMYGVGLFISPFVATAVASSTPRWMLFYLFPLGLSVVNLTGVLVAFRDVMGMKKESGEEGRNRSAMMEIRQMMKIRTVWIISLFFFFHLGVGFTAGGMYCDEFL
jgi:fucose permease